MNVKICQRHTLSFFISVRVLFYRPTPNTVALFFCRFYAENTVLFLNYNLWYFRFRTFWGFNYKCWVFRCTVVLLLRERNNLILKNIIVLYLQIYNTQNFILSKMSTSVSFLKYSSNFADFCFDILTKYILTKKKRVWLAQMTTTVT